MEAKVIRLNPDHKKEGKPSKNYSKSDIATGGIAAAIIIGIIAVAAVAKIFKKGPVIEPTQNIEV